MILNRSTLIPLSIFSIHSTTVMYPVFIDSGSIVAKIIFASDTQSFVSTVDNNLEITLCLGHPSTSRAISKNRILNYKVHNDNNAYFFTIQGYNPNYTDKYGSTIIEKTNLNLSHDSWSYTSLAESGKIHSFYF